MAKKELTVAGMVENTTNDKNLTESATKVHFNAAIKITWEKILTLMLPNGANWH